MNRILVAVDFSASSDLALTEAARLARRGQDAAPPAPAQVGVCHVLPNVMPVHPLFPQHTGRSMLAVADLEHRASLAVGERFTACDEGAASGPPLDVLAFVDPGDDEAAAIVARATSWKPSVLVIGSHGRTGLARALLGSVSEEVARRAPCPVLVARGDHRAGPVIVATDLTETSLHALHAAAAEAKARGVGLVAVFALDVPTDFLPYGVLAPFGVYEQTPGVDDIRELRAAATETLTTWLAAAKVEATAIVVDGRAAQETVKLAESLGAQLVVCATHARGGLDRLAMGSVTESILRHAHCSVLVVRMEKDGATA